MTANPHQPLRLLSDALRGVGSPFGGARRIEFFPALPGGHGFADLEETSSEVLEAMESATKCATLNGNTEVVAWAVPGSQIRAGMLISQLKDLKYEGGGTWELQNKQRIRLLEDRHVLPTTDVSGPRALLSALMGNG